MRHDRMQISSAAVLVALLGGCSAAPPAVGGTTPPAGIAGNVVRVDQARPSILEFRYVKAEDVWVALPAAFAALEIPANVMDPGARIYGNPDVRASSIAGRQVRTLFRCTNEGTGASTVTQYRVEFGIAAQPRALQTNEGSELIVQIQAVGRITDATRTGTIHCVSNGTIERQLKRQIELEVAKRMG